MIIGHLNALPLAGLSFLVRGGRELNQLKCNLPVACCRYPA